MKISLSSQIVDKYNTTEVFDLQTKMLAFESMPDYEGIREATSKPEFKLPDLYVLNTD